MSEEKYSDSFLVQSYSDILRGYSVVIGPENRSNVAIPNEPKKERQRIYIKHFTYVDNYELEVLKEKYAEKLKKQNIPSEEEIKVRLKKNGGWTQQNDDDLFFTSDFIERLKVTKTQWLTQKERDETQRTIDEEQKKVDKLKWKLESQLAGARERFIDKKLTDFYIFLSYYYDSDFKNRVFDENKIKDIEDLEFGEYVTGYKNSLGAITNRVIKFIAIQPFFTNCYFLAKSAYEFLGKPTSQFTFYQSNLLAYGQMFHSILGNGMELPANVKDDPDKILEFVTTKQNTAKQTENLKPGTRIMGATSKDYEDLGLPAMTQSTIQGMQNRQTKR